MNIRSVFVLTAFSALTLSLGACIDGTGTSDSEDTMATSPTTSESSTSSTGSTGSTGSTSGTDSDSEGTTTDPSTSTSTSSTTTTGETDSTSTTTTTGGGDLTCDAYCGIYAEACADFPEYADTAECLAQCNQWPVGEADATGGDSLGCRLYHVTVAKGGDALIHCPHAGPSGDGVCVDEGAPTCTDYCDTYMMNCTDKNNVYEGDLDACMTACATWYPGSNADTAGDTIGCRTYHAGAPAMGDPVQHCPHAGPSGADVCVPG